MPADPTNPTARTDPSGAIAEALGELVAIAAPEREAWVLDRFPGDPAARAELLSLVTHVSPDASPAASDARGEGGSADPWLGRSIAGCTVIRLLGAGGMGRVYEARQAGTGRMVALKLLDHGTTSEFLAARLRAEGAALGALEHPTIARVYQAGVAATEGRGAPYVVMEMVRDARDARGWAATTALGTADLLERLATCCDAIHYGHQRGVIHGDLKPSNILVDPDDRPRIIDFGTARLQDAVHRDERQADPYVAATPRYAAPELLASRRSRPDARSDVYGLGRVLVDVRDASPARRWNGRQRRDLDAIISRATAEQADARYESAAALGRDLRALASDGPVAARPTGRFERVARFMRHHPGTAAAIAAAVLTIAASMLALTAAERRTRHALAVSELSQAARAVQAGELAEALGRLSLVRRLGTVDGFLVGMLARRTDQSIAELANGDGGNCTAAVAVPGTDRLLVTCDQGLLQCRTSGDGPPMPMPYRGRGTAGALPNARGGIDWIACRDGTLLRAATGSPGASWTEQRPIPGIGIQSIAPGAGGAAILGMDDGTVMRVDPAGRSMVLATPSAPSNGYGAFVAPGPGGDALAALPDGRVLLVATDAHGSSREIHRHDSVPSAAVWDARHATAAIGYRDGKVVLIRPGDGHRTVLGAFANSIWSIAIAPDGCTIAVGDRAGTLQLLDANTLEEIQRLHAGTSDPFWWVTFEASGDTLLALAGHRLVRLPARPSEPTTIRLPTTIRRLVELPDGRVLALTADGVLHRVAVGAGTACDARQALDVEGSRAVAIGPRSGAIAAVVGNRLIVNGAARAEPAEIAPGVKVLLAWSTDESVLWILEGRRVRAVDPDGRMLGTADLGSVPEIPAIMALRDGSLAVSSAHGTWIVGRASDGLVATPHPANGYQCWPIDDGLALAAPNGAVSWLPMDRLDDPADARQFKGHTDTVWACDFDPTRRLLVTGGSDRKVRIWDFDTGEQLLSLAGHEATLTAVRWLAHGRILATADAAGLIHVWTDLPVAALDGGTDPCAGTAPRTATPATPPITAASGSPTPRSPG